MSSGEAFSPTSRAKPPRAHHFATGYNTTGAAIMDNLRKACEKLGVKVLTETRATKLLTDSSGAITGVSATGKNGEITIDTKCAVVATGALYGNKELIKKSIPWPQTYEPEEFVPWGLDHPGDGFQMATEVGVAREGPGHVANARPDLRSGTAAAGLYNSHYPFSGLG